MTAMTRYPAFSRPGNDSKRMNSMRRRLLFILGLPMMLAAFGMSAKAAFQKFCS
jgi:hypothetical protein